MSDAAHLKAVGDIHPCRFMKITDDFIVSQASSTGDTLFGIAHDSVNQPTAVITTNLTHASTGETVSYYKNGDVCLLEIGGTVNAGDVLTTDTTGRGVSSDGNSGAIAIDSGVEGDRIFVQIVVGANTVSSAKSGYEFTGGFEDRTTGLAGQSDVGSNVLYTTAMATNERWLRFGFSSAQQITNDVAYWTDPTPAPTAGVGLFGGSYMPPGVTSLYDFTFNSASYSDAVESGSLQYTQADGSLDFTQCQPGDLAIVRFDFNVLPQVANSTLEVGLIWQTRDANDNPTFTFALAGQPVFFGTGTVGQTFLNRPLLTAYFASEEDVNARALPAIRCDNQIQIQPLTILTTVVR